MKPAVSHRVVRTTSRLVERGRLLFAATSFALYFLRYRFAPGPGLVPGRERRAAPGRVDLRGGGGRRAVVEREADLELVADELHLPGPRVDGQRVEVHAVGHVLVGVLELARLLLERA